jgi:retron-type reverse transcriptase
MIDYLWTMEPAYKVNNPPKRLEEIKRALMSSTFRFSSMYRSWIPKPNKPGKMRPITQPHKEDFIVMDALSQLLNIVFEDIFLTQSHGFRKGRGPITFFAHVQSWGEVDRLIKADIVGCFDNIDHALLNSRVRLNIGNHNEN